MPKFIKNAILKFMENAAQLNASGIAYTEANMPVQAIDLFERAITIEPGNPQLWANMGIAQQKSGDFESALESFGCAISLDSSLADPWYSMGLIYYQLHELEEAEACYHQALMRDEMSPKVWNNLGVLHFSQGRYGDARVCFEQAVRFSPLYYDALFNLRDTCRELRDFKAAAEYARVLSQFKSSNSAEG